MEKSCVNCCYYGSCTDNTPCEYYIHINQINTIPDIVEGVSRDWDTFSYEQQKSLSEELEDGAHTVALDDELIRKYTDIRRSDFYNEWFEYINQF